MLTSYRPKLTEHVSIDSRQLADHVGQTVRLAGVLEAMRTAPTSRGKRVTFLTLDDEFGLFEAVVFDRSHRTAVRGYGPHIIAGRVQEQYGTMTVIADSVNGDWFKRGDPKDR